jgi:hypothetical protein
MNDLKHRLVVGGMVLIVGWGLSLATAQPPDPRPGATQPVRELNLDESGAIRVHEQGTAEVKVTNDSLAVAGTVDVANFPAKYDVNVIGGEMRVKIEAEPAKGILLQSFLMAPDTLQEFFFPNPMMVWTLHVQSPNDSEAVVGFEQNGFRIFTIGNENFAALGDGRFVTLPKPVEIDALKVLCSNSLAPCDVRVTVIGE